jgi:hypothetical protein
MIVSLTTQLGKFPGAAHHVRCLAHIVNLVVQIILRQFDVPKKKKPPVGSEDGENKLAQASEEDEEEEAMDNGTYNEEGSEDAIEHIAAIEQELSDDIARAAKHVKAVQHVLVKVCSHCIPSALIFDSLWTI